MTGQPGRAYRKTTVGMSNEVHDALTWMKVEMDVGTVTDVVKRSVALMKFVLEHKDCELLIRRPDGELERIVIL